MRSMVLVVLLVAAACGGGDTAAPTGGEDASSATTGVPSTTSAATTPSTTTSAPVVTTVPATTVPVSESTTTASPVVTTVPATTVAVSESTTTASAAVTTVPGTTVPVSVSTTTSSAAVTTVPATTVPVPTASTLQPAQPDDRRPPNPFVNLSQEVRECVAFTIGAARLQELLVVQAGPSELEALQVCIADPSARVLPPPPEGGVGVVGEPDPPTAAGAGGPPAVECPTPDPGPTSSTAWITENGRILDADDLGHSPVAGVEDQNIGSSDPRVVTLDDGSYRLYFAAFSDGVMTATSADGISWALGPQALPPGGPHVSLVALPGGGWRLYVVTDSAGVSYVESYTTSDGLTFTADDGRRITDREFPYGPIQSPFVLQMTDGTYRMYLTTVPKGESVGQAGGNSAHWMVSATSTDMLEWTADPTVAVTDMLHPWAGLEDDGSVTVYGGKVLTKLTSVDGATFSAPEYLDVWGADYHVVPLVDDQVRLYTGAHDYDEGSWLRVLRSSTVPWDVTLLDGGWVDGDFQLKVCVTGSSSTPIELHLTDQDFRYREPEREARAIDVASGIPPFEATVSLGSGGAVGEQDIERLLRVTDGTAVREWRILEQMYFFDNGYNTTAN